MTRSRRAAVVAAGGAAGALARVVLAELLPQAAGDPTLVAPAVLVVNLSGSMLAGFLRGLLERDQTARRVPESMIEKVDAFMIVGFCGGYTSYSAFVGAFDGALRDSPVVAWGIAVATLVLCPLAALAGMRLSGGYPARPAAIDAAPSDPNEDRTRPD